jgi:lipopolysaccharide export LptBFGC system permease protein LptF
MKLKNKGISFYNFDEPYGYKLGDGRWGFNLANGFTPSEKGKKYKLKEFDYDIIHNLNSELTSTLQKLYPNSIIFNEKNSETQIEEVLNEYNKILNG